MSELFRALEASVGDYEGEGINHEGQPFLATFSLSPLLMGRGYEVRFAAKSKGVPERLFHEERSTIAQTEDGSVALFNLNTNTPFLCEHRCVSSENRGGRLSILFRFGAPENTDHFREDVRFTTLPGEEIDYSYAWGLPKGEFADRSSAKMKKIR